MRLSIWRTWCYFEAQYMRLAISWCYFEAQVWKKDSSIAPFYLFSFFWAFFFSLAFLFFWGGQCSIEWWSSHFYLFTTQWLQLDSKTKYDSIWKPLAVYRDMQWIKSDMYEKLWRWTCHKYDVNYIIVQRTIWQWWCVSYKWNGGKLHGNISQNGYGNAIIGRYGGCFRKT